MKGIESNSSNEAFVFPSIESEIGEIRRVAKLFSESKPSEFEQTFIERSKQAQLTELDENQWGALENTDSHDITQGDWEAVQQHAEAHEISRDWQSLRSKIEQGVSLDAPIIVRVGTVLHLVSGNTRLMVARAAGISPHILLVDMADWKDS
jgi:hypothetical protein